jgi:PleD family two-component response regulator
MTNLDIFTKKEALILIVEDDRMMRLQIRLAMQKEGYRVIEATDGQEALERYAEEKPDLILLDAMMPVMDGFVCCEKLQELPEENHPPVLMITGLEDHESVERAFEVGAIDYVNKPIHWAVLRQRVKRLLESYWATVDLKDQLNSEKDFKSISDMES